MGLIRAALQSAGGVLADQWKEYFHCYSMTNDQLVVKGTVRTDGNNKGRADIISNGSAIAVNEGQVALIVEDGKIVDFSAEPGRFIWNNSTEPSCFTGGFFKGIGESFKKFGERFTYGGDTAKVQRVYYINAKEITGNKFGTSTPMPYDDPYYKTALYIRYFGQYSFKISDPIVFFVSIAGNVADTYSRETLIQTCTDEFMTALDTSLAMCSGEGIKFSLLPVKQREIAAFMSSTLDEEWNARRGMQIVSVALSKVTPDDKSRSRIEEFDTNVMHSSTDAMAGGLAYAQMQAMQNAAKNEGGSMTGFLGLGMAQGVMGSAEKSQSTLLGASQSLEENKKQDAAKDEKPDGWKCECGQLNAGKFCSECGKAQPKKEEYVCSCGHREEKPFRFCPECGSKFEEVHACSCGYKSGKPFKFCPECGNQQ